MCEFWYLSFCITNMYIYTKIESLGQSDKIYADFKIISKGILKQSESEEAPNIQEATP